MIIEIRGTNFTNKGAELMLHAIINELLTNYKDNLKLVVDSATGSYIDRALLGLYQKVWFPNKFSVSFNKFLSEKVPGKIKNNFGLVSDSDIDIILDASGFAYSDQWGPGPAERTAVLTEHWKKSGKKVIFLPQAYGPFSNDSIRASMKKIIENVDIMFARDPISYKYLTDIVGPKDNIKLSPDFTNILHVNTPSNHENLVNRPCIVPNYRMLDKTGEKESNYYRNLLVDIISYLQNKNYDPFILIHDLGKDLQLAKEVEAKLLKPIQIVNESDSLSIKAILGTSKFVISSRFHGLVSSLSQAVPSIATGWSHKYEMLFEDYECSNLIIKTFESQTEVFSKLEQLTNDDSYNAVKSKLIKNANLQKNKAREMWTQVHELIGAEEQSLVRV